MPIEGQDVLAGIPSLCPDVHGEFTRKVAKSRVIDAATPGATRFVKDFGGIAPDGGSRCRPAIQMGSD